MEFVQFTHIPAKAANHHRPNIEPCNNCGSSNRGDYCDSCHNGTALIFKRVGDGLHTEGAPSREDLCGDGNVIEARKKPKDRGP